MRLPSWWTRKRFAVARLVFWGVQLPPAMGLAVLKHSLTYLIFLSLAALIESAGTDYDQALQAERKRL